MGNVGLGNAQPCILHRNLHLLMVLFGRQLHTAAFGRVFDGIREQIVQRLPQLLRVYMGN